MSVIVPATLVAVEQKDVLAAKESSFLAVLVVQDYFLFHEPWLSQNQRFSELIGQQQRDIVIVKSYLSLEPIGILFVLFFAVILVIQFIGMIMHRLSTLSHLLASTTLRIGSKSSEIDLNNGIVNESVIEDLKKIAKLPDVNNLDMGKPQVSGPRKTTIAHLLQRADKELTVGTIAESLNNVFESVTDTKGTV
uniref:Uncharacterized protein n=1 Tax=Timema poppense TaxID=170557 RepID=A0A7R9DG58_TIMPO|nr:unnamed protein product [Timema poppensis]